MVCSKEYRSLKVFFSLVPFYLATQKAKDFVAQINEQMKLYPEGYGSSDEVNDKQRGQYAEQKEVSCVTEHSAEIN